MLITGHICFECVQSFGGWVPPPSPREEVTAHIHFLLECTLIFEDSYVILNHLCISWRLSSGQWDWTYCVITTAKTITLQQQNEQSPLLVNQWIEKYRTPPTFEHMAYRWLVHIDLFFNICKSFIENYVHIFYCCC